jgi:hypothetical protein
MVRRTRSTTFLVPIQAAGVNPILILPENTNRELYSIQNMDAANSVFVSPNQNVTSAALSPYRGQEVVARGYVSDDMDQGNVYAIGIVAASQIVVQETISVQDTRPSPEPRSQFKAAGRTPLHRESRLM